MPGKVQAYVEMANETAASITQMRKPGCSFFGTLQGFINIRSMISC